MAIFNKSKNQNTEKKPMFSPRTKGIAFFVFYAFFFMFLITYSSDLTSSRNQNMIEEDNLPNYSIDMINSQNYKYVYTLIENDKMTIIEGEKNLEKEKFSVNKDNKTEAYFNNNGTILVNTGEWELYSEPTEVIPYSSFTDIKTINQLIKNSKFISKTEYAEKETVLEYQISTTTLVDIVDEEKIDIADNTNIIKLYLEGEEVIKVELELTPYVTYQLEEETVVTYSLSYTDFGTIPELNTD